MQNKKIPLILLTLLLFTATAQAGIISLLTKAGKAVKKIDIDVPVTKLELPNVADDVSPISIKPRRSGKWDLTLPDGKRVTLSAFMKNKKLGQQAFVINSTDLPSGLSSFNTIPDSLPVFIKTKNNRIFELQRGRFPAIKYKSIQVYVNNITELKDSLWHLQRPPVNNSVRVFQLDKSSKNNVTRKIYGSRVAVEKIDPRSLVDSFKTLKRQTVVISGEIRQGLLYNGTSSIPIKSLQKAAAENDVSLILIESANHAKVLKKIATDAKIRGKDVKYLYDTTGDFLSRFKDPTNTELMRVKLSNVGHSQSAIQFKPVETKIVAARASSSLSDISLIPFHLLGKSVSVYRPDQERSKELDRRIIPWMSTSIQYYFISSIILGLIAFSTSWTLWKKIWQIQSRSFHKNYFIYQGLGLIHLSLFIVLFIPLFGTLSFIYAVVMVIAKVINTLFIKPAVWLASKVTS